MGGFLSVNTVVEQKGFCTMLITFSFNPNFSIVDSRNAGNLAHEVSTRARKRLRGIICEKIPIATTSTKKTKELGGCNF